MAENLNKPGDFIAGKGKGMDLLPPSAFEVKPKSGDPWKELSRAAEELASLKQENAQLREGQRSVPMQEPVTKEPTTSQGTCQQPSSQGTCNQPSSEYKRRNEDMRYIDELINKQALEVTDLKNELRLLKCNHREELTDIERQLTTKEREYVHNLAALETELRAAESRYDAQVDRLSREHQQETDELTVAVEKLTDELTAIRRKAGSRIEELEIETGNLQQQLAQTSQELQNQLRSKESALENQRKQIEQLKKYIGESENIPQPVEMARREIESLSSKLRACEMERENLQSTIQLLNIRLTSMTEVLKLQECEISKNSLDIEKSKHEGLLLTRWREKVFALMVQQKSADISSRKDQQNWKSKSGDLEKKLSTALNQIDQLTHTLSDRTAQLDIERNNSKQLQMEVTEAQQVALRLDDTVNRNVSQAATLQSLADSIGQQFDEKVGFLNTALSSLKAYGQRISFASGRVEMIQGLLERRESISRLNSDTSTRISKEKIDTPKQQVKEIQNSEDESYLRQELLAVVKERDNLTAQIKQDTQLWEDKIHTIRTQYEEDLDNASQKIQDLEQIVREKTQVNQQLSDTLEDCQRDLEESNNSIDELKTLLAKQEINMDNLVEEQKKSVEEQFTEKLAEMDRKMNDAKREHVKAVVAVRQLERQSGREKERAEEHLKTTEEHYTRQINRLQEQLKATEAERNLMMATLRQEGLVGKLKSERREPVSANWEETNVEPVQEYAETVSPREVRDSQEPQTEEPLTSVLEDLEYLTSAVLKDNTSDTESDTET